MQRTFIIIALIFICSLTNAQNKLQEQANAWIELGSLRFFPTKHESGVGVNACLKYQKDRLLANLQYHDSYDRDLPNGRLELLTTSNHYHALNILGGFTNRKDRTGHVSASTGLGVFWGTIYYSSGYKKFSTVSWPVELAMSINIKSFIGLNFKVFTNLNSQHSFIGFGMDLQLGKLRQI
ncbi:MAG: hypothetical protein C0594_10850 [Marinilabiliales bacterium]|nr:MAG: hypothetical protein C0594_10850 [Marinilabiliales bacterium]